MPSAAQIADTPKEELLANKVFKLLESKPLVYEIFSTLSETNLITGLLSEKLVIKNNNKILSKSHLYPKFSECFILQ